MNQWTNPHRTGFLSAILQDTDPRPAAVQIAERYAHGGGWQPFGQGEWEIENYDGKVGEMLLKYPEDPPMKEIARCELNGELCVLFEMDWLAVFDTASSYFDVMRLD